MNSLLHVLSNQRVSPPPIWLMRQAGRYLPEYRELRAKAGGFMKLCLTPEWAAEVTLQPVRRFDVDAAILFSDILMVPYALGQNLTFAEGEGPRLPPIQRAQDIPTFRPDAFHAALTPIYETVKRVKEQLSPKTALIGFAGAPWTVASYMVEGGGGHDFAATKRWLYTDPEGFLRLLDMLVESTAEYIDRQVQAGAQAIQIFDSWAGVLSEADFDMCVIEPTRKLVKNIRQKHPRVPIIGFPRGAGLKYQNYIEKTDVTAVGLDTTVSLSWARDVLQKKRPVQGNIDPIALVVGGKYLDKAVDNLLHILGQGPLIVNLGHGIVPETPPEHVDQLIKRVRNP